MTQHVILHTSRHRQRVAALNVCETSRNYSTIADCPAATADRVFFDLGSTISALILQQQRSDLQRIKKPRVYHMIKFFRYANTVQLMFHAKTKRPFLNQNCTSCSETETSRAPAKSKPTVRGLYHFGLCIKAAAPLPPWHPRTLLHVHWHSGA